MYREIINISQGRAASDGAGVKLTRVFGGSRNAEQTDPFLMLDAFGSDEAADYIAGFPSHPHRGFETVTYMLEGRVLHEDHLGNRGLLQNGDVQWMTAARGIIHSEMPQQEEGRMSGFQLWVNLPAAEKLKDPNYRDIASADIPTRTVENVFYKIIAGDIQLAGEAIHGAVSGLSTRPVFVDIHFKEDQHIELDIPYDHTLLVYVYQGRASGGSRKIEISNGQLALFNREGKLALDGDKGTRLIVLAGKPLREPVVQYGPFVMNTVEEIEQAIQDYQSGTLTQ
ncbi:MAG: pirin family protein [Gammaproteobacteria bacterium]|nr:pirin family protein [Gammaproteobacteria bacterium]